MNDSNMLDQLWEAYIRRETLVETNALECALEAIDELKQHQIQKPLYGVLLDKKLLSREEVKEAGDIIAGFSFRCPHCREQRSVKEISRENTVTCKRCTATVHLSFVKTNDSIEKCIHAELLEKPSSEAVFSSDDSTAFIVDKAEGKQKNTPVPPPASDTGIKRFPHEESPKRRPEERLRKKNSWMNKIPHPVYILPFSVIVFVTGILFFLSRYRQWAEGTKNLNKKQLIKYSTQNAITTLDNEKEFLSNRETAKKAHLIESAYDGSWRNKKLQAIIREIPQQQASPWDKQAHLESALSSGRLLYALRLFTSNGLSPYKNIKTWSSLQRLADTQELVLKHREKIDLPGIQTFYHKPLLIDKYPVSCSTYIKFLTSTGSSMYTGEKSTTLMSAQGTEPVTGISYSTARALAEKQGKRLPTEYELRLIKEYLVSGFEWTAPGPDARGDTVYPLAVQYKNNRFHYRRFQPDARPENVTFRCVQEF